MTVARTRTRAYVAFAVLSVAFAAVVAWAIARERSSEWRQRETEFVRLVGARGASTAEVERGVQQVWITDLDRVDRCTTCHRAIDDPGFYAARQPFRSHPGNWLVTHPAERFGCTSCHGGQGEATTWRDAAHEPIAYWPVPMRRGPLLEAGCGTCHRERRPAGAPVLAAGREAIVRAGCAGCHDIRGFTTEEIHAPRLESIGWKVRPGWLRRYLAKPGLVTGARMPDFRLAPKEVAALDAFLRSQRKTPPLDATAVDWSRADPERGRELYARARCVTCHRIDERGGTLGPDLSFIGSRVRRDWLWSYLTDPFRDQPDTLMPRFKWTADEARDVATYLTTDLVEPDAPPEPTEDAMPGRAAIDEGRTAFIKHGCYGCHRLPGTEALAKIGPALAGVGDKAVESSDFRGQRVQPTLPNWLYLKLRAPDTLIATSWMPTFAITDPERVSIVVALLSLTKRDVPLARVTRDVVGPAQPPQGRAGQIVAEYRCLSCHEYQGSGGRLSTVALDRIGSQLRPDYLAAFLRSPSTVRVGLELRMPRMNISEDEAKVLVDYAGSALIDDRLAAWTPPPAGAERTGATLYERLGCQGCHSIEGKGGYVGPDLSGVGRRLQPGWIAQWLATPSRWKPGTLHPDYGLPRDQVDELTAYMLTLTRKTAPK